jgi:hypothetical protein
MPNSQNGHCIVGVGGDTVAARPGYNALGVNVCTWGLLGTMTWAAVAALTAEGAGGQLYALLSPDSISKATSKAPSGFDFPTLQGDLEELQKASRGGLLSWL